MLALIDMYSVSMKNVGTVSSPNVAIINLYTSRTNQKTLLNLVGKINPKIQFLAYTLVFGGVFHGRSFSGSHKSGGISGLARSIRHFVIEIKND
jgi:hypothetical protein